MSAAFDRRLLVLRHGLTEHNQRQIWQGHLDTDLTDIGREQARAAAAMLRHYRPQFVVSSDLRRARITAEIVAAAIGLEVRADERLREIHGGSWQGLTAGEVAEGWPELREAVRRGDDVRRGGSGESVTHVLERARPAVVEALETLKPGRTGLLVSHGVTGRALVADLVGLDQATAWTCLSGLGNCAWAVLDEVGQAWRLRAWNLCAPDGADAPDLGLSPWGG